MLKLKEAGMKLWKDEEGLGTLEILLILAVLVAIAIVFREWIMTWVNKLFNSTAREMDGVSTKISKPDARVD